MKKYRFYIGIDTGTKTGFSVWNKPDKKLITVECIKIHTALSYVQLYHTRHFSEVYVRVEDARLRKWLPKEIGPEQLQGAGSIKRDATIWEDFLKELGIGYEMVAPKKNKTKLKADLFKKITGWPWLTNEHARDSAMLVYGL